jgi:putative transposase
MVSEEELRREAVRRRLAGESVGEVGQALGRTTRWVRKWVARAEEETGNERWAEGHSRAPHSSPARTPAHLRQAIVDARSRLVANPRAQYGPLAIAWELRRMGVEPIPGRWTIERVLRAEGLARPRRRQPGYVSKGVPYPAAPDPAPGAIHQIDLIGPRHLEGAVQFHALNLIDVGSHLAASAILGAPRPGGLAASMAGLWTSAGVPTVAQFDNHSNFRGGIPPDWTHFGPVVATCLDLDVIPRFIPLREPWRNGVVDHFNDVWDKAFFRTARFSGLDHLVAENASFVTFHNEHHRYSAHAGASPNEIWSGRIYDAVAPDYQIPTSLPAKGRIEVVRYIRSNRRVDLFGKRLTVAEEHTHQYVTATIAVRAKHLTVITMDGEIIHDGEFSLSRELR